jgi:hypothetical protein
MAYSEGEILIERPVEVGSTSSPTGATSRASTTGCCGSSRSPRRRIRLGTQFRADVKTMGRVAELTIEFTGYQRPGRLSSVTHMPRLDS